MKQINILLLLLFCLFAGCKDNEEEPLFNVTKTYPTEAQVLFTVTNCEGILSYDDDLHERCINVPGTNVWDVYIVTKLPKDLKGYKGNVRFSGEALYLYCAFKLHPYICTLPMNVYSLEWTEISKVE